MCGHGSHRHLTADATSTIFVKLSLDALLSTIASVIRSTKTDQIKREIIKRKGARRWDARNGDFFFSAEKNHFLFLNQNQSKWNESRHCDCHKRVKTDWRTAKFTVISKMEDKHTLSERLHYHSCVWAVVFCKRSFPIEHITRNSRLLNAGHDMEMFFRFSLD